MVYHIVNKTGGILLPAPSKLSLGIIEYFL